MERYTLSFLDLMTGFVGAMYILIATTSTAPGRATVPEEHEFVMVTFVMEPVADDAPLPDPPFGGAGFCTVRPFADGFFVFFSVSRRREEGDQGESTAVPVGFRREYFGEDFQPFRVRRCRVSGEKMPGGVRVPVGDSVDGWLREISSLRTECSDLELRFVGGAGAN